MATTNDPLTQGITIKETVDGVAIEQPTMRRVRKPKARPIYLGYLHNAFNGFRN